MNEKQASLAPSPVGAYPLARWVGDLLFMSGVGPRQAGTNEVPGNQYDESGQLVSYDIEQQFDAVFRNVGIILREYGLDMEHLVDVTVFLTDMKQDFSTFNRRWADSFRQNPPCRTTIEVGALPTPIAIELKCVAARRIHKP